MKASHLDFVLCGGAISAILAGTLGLLTLLLPLSIAVAADYHIVVDFLLALLFYGLLSALVVRLLLRFRPMEAGEYSLDCPVFTYWKLLTILHRLGQGALLPFTPVFLKPLVEALWRPGGCQCGSRRNDRRSLHGHHRRWQPFWCMVPWSRETCFMAAN